MRCRTATSPNHRDQQGDRLASAAQVSRHRQGPGGEHHYGASAHPSSLGFAKWQVASLDAVKLIAVFKVISFVDARAQKCMLWVLALSLDERCQTNCSTINTGLPEVVCHANDLNAPHG